MPTDAMTHAAEPFAWSRWPTTEAFVARQVDEALAANPFARRLADRMAAETSTRFVDWVDHLVLPGRPGLADELRTLGYARSGHMYAVNAAAYAHGGGVFPAVILAPGDGPQVREVAIKVESLAAFSAAHDLGLEPEGYPLGPYRVGRLPGGETTFAAVERRGYRGFETFPGDLARAGLLKPHAARDALAAREVWQSRRRAFPDDEAGFIAAEHALERMIELCGSRDLACHLVFEVERDYWQSRNHAARVQKARQDRLGLGWANHDHHTFRSSRRFFPRLMRMFEALGFRLRERFHAGAQAGWGAQVLEHPTTGVVIFADLDLAPEEAGRDFAREVLPELARPNTVGLWVGLHGESILGAGMHHLEAQFEFDALCEGLKAEAGVETMKPFSDFPFLRQAFTVGERWAVDPARVKRLSELGWIDAGQAERFVREGAIGSHLENLQRREGYKGFNQQAVSAILNEVDPRRH